jgi:putative mRNA 3-end processing factor
MLKMTHRGLYCQIGDFYIDPSGAVDHAVITHSHADHARRGSKQYYCVSSGIELLKTRVGKNISVSSYHYGQSFYLKGVKVSFHPAGHILGSSQIRLEYGGEVWVASGDYKRDPDPTCEPFEVVPCDVFVTEATFGTPGYVWPKDIDLGKEIFDWWSENAGKGINSVLFAYSLGKAQRVLGVLEPYAKKPIYCHTTVTPLNECYRAQGIKLAETKCLSKVEDDRVLTGELFLVPQSFLKSEKAELLGRRYETAFASGWTARSTYGIDKGFVMSDHADWNDLLLTIKQTGAKQVYVQHRNGSLIRHLKSIGIQAFSDKELNFKEPAQLDLF